MALVCVYEWGSYSLDVDTSVPQTGYVQRWAGGYAPLEVQMFSLLQASVLGYEQASQQYQQQLRTWT
eukprot:2567312-Amphidinium_carterae.1